MARFLLVLALATLSPLANAAEFCVQTFNVHGTAFASRSDHRLRLLSTALAETPCDAVLIQELWMPEHFDTLKGYLSRGWPESHYADSTRRDQRRIGLASFFQGSVHETNSQLYRVNYGDGLFDWVRGLSGVEKGYLTSTVELEDGPRVTFLNTHMNPRDKVSRVAQSAELLEKYLSLPVGENLPLVIAGDLNGGPDSASVVLLRDVLLMKDAYLEFKGSYEKGVCTFCSENYVLDYVLYRSSPTMELKIRMAEINLKGTKADPISDHYGVRAILSYDARQAALLPADAPEVIARRKTALKAISGALKVLETNPHERYEPARAYLQALGREIESGPSGTLAEHFRSR